MYARNTIARRRSPGWADRRRYYRRLFELSRQKALKDQEVQESVPPAIEKD
jgi:hypothetical protein